jgi:hypothetical protein
VATAPDRTPIADRLPENVCNPVAAHGVCRITTDAASGGHVMNTAFADRFADYQARLNGISEVVSKSQPVSVLIQKARRLLYQAAAVRAAS